jgi:hypothetical protein
MTYDDLMTWGYPHFRTPAYNYHKLEWLEWKKGYRTGGLSSGQWVDPDERINNHPPIWTTYPSSEHGTILSKPGHPCMLNLHSLGSFFWGRWRYTDPPWFGWNVWDLCIGRNAFKPWKSNQPWKMHVTCCYKVGPLHNVAAMFHLISEFDSKW